MSVLLGQALQKNVSYVKFFFIKIESEIIVWKTKIVSKN